MPRKVITECDRNLGFLICDVARLVRRSFNSRARDTGLTQAQWQAMFVISRNPGINQVGLADLLEIHPITLTQQIDRMEAAGWVERRPDPKDRRAMRLYITAQGKPILERLREFGAAILSIGLADINPKLRETMVDALVQIRNRFVSAEARVTRKGRKRSAAKALPRRKSARG